MGNIFSAKTDIITLEKVPVDPSLRNRQQRQTDEKEDLVVVNKADLLEFQANYHTLSLEVKQITESSKKLQVCYDGIVQHLKDSEDSPSECDTCNSLIMAHRELTDDKTHALKIGLSCKYLRRSQKIFGLLQLSNADIEALRTTKFSPDDLHMDFVCNPSFYPYKVIMVNGIPKEQLDEKNSMLKELNNECSPSVVKEILRAKKEILDFNASGNCPVTKLINADGTIMKTNDLVKALVQKLDSIHGRNGDLEKQLRQANNKVVNLERELKKKRKREDDLDGSSPNKSFTTTVNRSDTVFIVNNNN